MRNDGPDPVRVAQVIVNDGFASFTQTRTELGRLEGSEITVRYPWIEGQGYEVVLVTATGATIDHAIDAAVETPDADLGFYGLMALIGLYVGVIPVAIGMLWLPWMRAVDPRWIRFLLAFTVGLLAFLGIEALLEGTELAGGAPQALGGAALVWVGAAGAYLALAGVDAWLRGRRERGRAERSRVAARRRRAVGDGARRRGGRLPRRLPGRARHRPAQPRRGPRDRLRLRDRLARARRRAGRRLRAAQHHRGPRDRGAGRARRAMPALRTLAGSGCSRERRPCWAPGSAPRPTTRAWPR